MDKPILVKDFMTVNVVSVEPDTPLLKAVDLLLDRGFNGLPVVSPDGTIAGILTEYDLVLRGSPMHLPTFLKLFRELEFFKKDQTLIRDDIKKVLDMKVKDAMNPEPLTLRPEQTIEEAVWMFTEHHRANPLLVATEDRRLAGILSRRDLIQLFHAPSVEFDKKNSERDLDKNVERFVHDFEKEFVLVSKYRTRHWLLVSILFAIVGFIIAFAIIVRVKF